MKGKQKKDENQIMESFAVGVQNKEGESITTKCKDVEESVTEKTQNKGKPAPSPADCSSNCDTDEEKDDCPLCPQQSVDKMDNMDNYVEEIAFDSQCWSHFCSYDFPLQSWKP